MEEKRIKIDNAKLALEKGFNEETDILFHVYKGTVNGYFTAKANNKSCLEDSDDLEQFYCRPTQSFLQTWLRDVHNIEVFVRKGYGYEWYIEGTSLGDGTYNSYEEALEDGLKEGLKLIK